MAAEFWNFQGMDADVNNEFQSSFFISKQIWYIQMITLGG